MSDRLIYHITSAEEWYLAQSKEEYEPRQFSDEGFIHCSHAHQLEAVVNRFFQGQKNHDQIHLRGDRQKIPISCSW